MISFDEFLARHMPADVADADRAAIEGQLYDIYRYEQAETLDQRPWDEDEDDGQPSEYEEWQDFYGGDDWDHGQYDSCEEW